MCDNKYIKMASELINKKGVISAKRATKIFFLDYCARNYPESYYPIFGDDIGYLARATDQSEKTQEALIKVENLVNWIRHTRTLRMIYEENAKQANIFFDELVHEQIDFNTAEFDIDLFKKAINEIRLICLQEGKKDSSLQKIKAITEQALEDYSPMIGYLGIWKAFDNTYCNLIKNQATRLHDGLLFLHATDEIFDLIGEYFGIDTAFLRSTEKADIIAQARINIKFIGDLKNDVDEDLEKKDSHPEFDSGELNMKRFLQNIEDKMKSSIACNYSNLQIDYVKKQISKMDFCKLNINQTLIRYLTGDIY